jgi:hypothetical protein
VLLRCPEFAIFSTAQKLRFTYSFFGLTVRSNLSLPGVASSDQVERPPDLDVHLEIPPPFVSENSTPAEKLAYESSYTSESGEPGLRIWENPAGSYLRLAYHDGTQFWIDRERSNLWATWPRNQSLENAASYLLGPVFGLLLRLRGVTCLHASAVAFDETCIVFVGPAGAGKSTTAAAFAKAGFAILSDDIVAIREGNGLFQVLPAYPHICLWPESVEMLYGTKDALPRFTLDWDKRCLALGTETARFADRTLPLGAAYLLYPRHSGPASVIEELRPQNALLTLVANTYATNILDRAMRAQEFALLGRLVARTPAYKITASNEPRHLDEFCRAIQDHYRASSS